MGCRNHTDGWQILEASESIMEENPDSAFFLLSSIDALKLRKGEERALYSLLMTQALTKEGYILCSDSVIGKSVDYYSKRGSKERQIKSLYYLADILDNQGRQVEAMSPLLNAYDISCELGNPLWRARTSELIGHIFNLHYDNEQWTKYTQESAQYYEITGKIANHRYELCDYASSLANGGQFQRGALLIDSMMDIASADPCDEGLLGYALSMRIPPAIWMGDYATAARCVDSLFRMVDYGFSSSDYVNKAAVETHRGNFAEAMVSLDRADSLSTALSDKIKIVRGRISLSKQSGDIGSLMLWTDSLVSMQNRALITVMGEPIMEAQRDYYNQAAIKERNRTNDLKKNSIFMGVGILLLMVILTVWYQHKMKEKIQDIQLLSLQLTRKGEDSQQLKEEMESLFQSSSQMLNRVCEEFFEKGDSAATRKSILHALETEINNMKSPSNLREIEKAVNKYVDNAMVKLRAECTFLKESEITLIMLKYAGFSARAICLFLGISTQNLYSRKSRISAKILASDAPHREWFTQKLAKI